LIWWNAVLAMKCCAGDGTGGADTADVGDVMLAAVVAGTKSPPTSRSGSSIGTNFPPTLQNLPVASRFPK
jgi:hypothetical protein